MRRQNKVYAFSAIKRDTSVSLHELWEKYEQAMHRRGLSLYTIKHEHENFTSISKYLSAEQDISVFTAEDFECVFDTMRARSLSPVTINGRIKTLRRILDHAHRHDLVVVNQALKVEKMKEVEKPVPSLTLVDINKLLSQPNLETFTGLRNRTMIELILDCGIRLREMLDLTVDQIDLGNRQLKDVHRKTRKLADIKISRPMVDRLVRYLHERGKAGTDALFVTIDETPVRRRTFQDDLHDYGQAAQIQGVRVSPHTLRHTFAKFYILNGGDPFSLQHILGHADMSMVKRYVTMWGHEVQALHDKYSPLVTIIQ